MTIGNVGIGTTSPNMKLVVSGGVRVVPGTYFPQTRPGCDLSKEGTFWVTGTDGFYSTAVQVCGCGGSGPTCMRRTLRGDFLPLNY